MTDIKTAAAPAPRRKPSLPKTADRATELAMTEKPPSAALTALLEMMAGKPGETQRPYLLESSVYRTANERVVAECDAEIMMLRAEVNARIERLGDIETVRRGALAALTATDPNAQQGVGNAD